MNPDTFRIREVGQFDLNTLRLDGDIFESGKEKLRILKYLDTCGRRGLTVTSVMLLPLPVIPHGGS